MSQDDASDFDDFERECFGDEDGCDVDQWGGPPEWREFTEASKSRMETSLDEGRAAIEERRRKQSQEASVRERIRAMARKGDSES